MVVLPYEPRYAPYAPFALGFAQQFFSFAFYEHENHSQILYKRKEDEQESRAGEDNGANEPGYTPLCTGR